MKRKGRKRKYKNSVSISSNSSKSVLSSLRARRLFSLAWKCVASLGVLLGLVVSLYNLSARVAVSSSDISVNPHKPFSSPFNVKNCGILPFYNVQFSYGVRDVKLSNGNRMINLATSKVAPFIKRIDAGETTTTFIVFDEIFRPETQTTTVESADIEVMIKYKPAYLLWSKVRSVRFVTVTESDGTLRWVPKALSE
jgi:hypothetical protein